MRSRLLNGRMMHFNNGDEFSRQIDTDNAAKRTPRQKRLLRSLALIAAKSKCHPPPLFYFLTCLKDRPLRTFAKITILLKSFSRHL